MSHFLLWVGDFFNVHPLTHASDGREAVVVEDLRRSVLDEPDARVSDELALLSLSPDGTAKNPWDELRIFALLSDVGTTRNQPEKGWPADRWM